MELENFLSNEKGSEIDDIPSLVILWSKVTFSTYFILRTYELAFATNVNVNKSKPSWQCDQMEKLFFQYLAIHDNEKMPNGQKIDKVGSIFGQILNKPSKTYQSL